MSDVKIVLTLDGIVLTSYSEVAIAWMRPLDLRLPSVPAVHVVEEILKEAEWKAYPTAVKAVTFFPFIIHEQRYHLFTIAAELLPLVINGNPQDSPLEGHAVLEPITMLDQLSEIEQKLQKWYRHLPTEAKADIVNETPVSGPVLDMQSVLWMVA